MIRYTTLPFRRPHLIEGAFCLTFFFLLKKVISFRRLASLMGKHKALSSSSLPLDQLEQARRIGQALRSLSLRLPWGRNCLTQALTAQAMLRRRNISSTLYFGVGSSPSERFRAHAWLRCGSEIVTGNGELDQFRVISTFASGPFPNEPLKDNGYAFEEAKSGD